MPIHVIDNGSFKIRCVMKKIHFILIIICFFYNPISATVYIKLNLNDCLNCLSVLYELEKMSEIDTLNIILPQSELIQQNELEEKFEFSKFKKMRVLFLDTLYKNIPCIYAENTQIIILNSKKKLIYNSLLKKVDLPKIRFFAKFGKEQIISTEKIYNIKRDYFDVIRNNVIFYNHFGNFSILNLSSLAFQDIKLDSIAIRGVYKNYYKDSFEKCYPVTLAVLNETPTTKPHLSTVQMVGNKFIFVIGFNDVRIVGEDTQFHIRHTLISYSSSTKKWSEPFTLKSKYLPKNYDIGRLTSMNGLPCLEINNTDNDLSSIGLITVDTILHEINLNNVINIIPTNKEIENKISNLEDKNSYMLTDLGYVYFYHDSMYSCIANKNIYIPLPFKKEVYNSAKLYNIRYDIYSKNYIVLYEKVGEGMYALEFNNNVVIQSKYLGSLDEMFYIYCSFLHNRAIIYYNKNLHGLQTIDL